MLLGYGEDSLTLGVLLAHTPAFLAALGDTTDESPIYTLYRPCFGRRAVAGKRGSPCSFGEFDAIIITASRTYLIEAKRTGSKEAVGAEVHLRTEQVRRHAAMRAYVEEWNACQPTGWADFVARSRIVPRLSSIDLRVPDSHSRLAKNLCYILGMTSDSSGEVQDVLLFIRDLSADGPRASPPTEVTEPGFIVVHARVNTFNEGWTLIAPQVGAPGVEFWRSPFVRQRSAA
jgi:hypothetical protein